MSIKLYKYDVRGATSQTAIDAPFIVSDELYEQRIDESFNLTGDTFEERCKSAARIIEEKLGSNFFVNLPIYQGGAGKTETGFLEYLTGREIVIPSYAATSYQNRNNYDGNSSTLLYKGKYSNSYALILGGTNSGDTYGVSASFSGVNGSFPTYRYVGPLFFRSFNKTPASAHGNAGFDISVHPSSFVSNDLIDTTYITDKIVILSIDANLAGGNPSISIKIDETKSTSVTNAYILDTAYVSSYNNTPVVDITPAPGPTPGGDPYSPIDDIEEEGGDEATLNWDTDYNELPWPEQTVLTDAYIYGTEAYKLTGEQLRALKRAMWDNDNIKEKLVSNGQALLDGIISIHTLPIDVETIGDVETHITIAGEIVGENVKAKTPQWIFERYPMGSVKMDKFYNGSLDYSPHATCHIYLPYIGCEELDINAIAHKRVYLTYIFNVYTGDCTAFVGVRDEDAGEQHIVWLYNFTGNAATQVPLSATSYVRQTQGMLTVLGGAGAIAAGAATIATGGSALPAIGAIAGGLSSAIMGGINSTSAPQAKKTGTLVSTFGYMGIQKPFLIITSPNIAKSADDKKHIAGAQWKTGKVGSFKGLTYFKDVHLDNVPATDKEKEMLLEILKNGVIL